MMIMILFDSLWVVAYLSLLQGCWRYIRMAKVSPARDDADIFEHFFAHTWPIFGFAVFSATGLVFSVFHLISQNITGWPPLDILEYGNAISGCGSLYCMRAYVTHATDEETPEHPFYIGGK